MSLQFVLLIAGASVILIVALMSIRGWNRERVNQETSQLSQPTLPLDPEELSGIPMYSGMDIFPPPPAEDDKKFLKADVDIIIPPRSKEKQFIDEIESIEDVASLSLNLNPGLDAPRHDVYEDYVWQTLPDDKVDFMIHFPGGKPVRRNKALGIYKQNEYLLEKPRYLYGQRISTQYWSELTKDPDSMEYSELMLALQMVDPEGAVDTRELNTFVQLGLKLADAVQRHPKLPLSIEQGLQQAKRLHEFCQSYDVIAAVNVVNEKKGFSGQRIERAANELGMQFGPLNIFHVKNYQSTGSRHLFSMANQLKPGTFDPTAWGKFHTKGLTLFMNVPCVSQPASMFDRMIETAKRLCRVLDGQLLDQDRKPLTDKGIGIIRAQIDDIGDSMRAFGIVAGSPTALRLFGTEAN